MKSALLHFSIALVASILALSGFGVWYAVIANKSTTVADLQYQIDAKTEMASRATSARAAMDEIASDESIVQSYFIPKTGVVTFINALEEQGKEQGTVVNVLSVSTGGTSAPATTVATGGSSAAATTIICPVGSERCPCYGNGTCNSGLGCLSGLCVSGANGGSKSSKV